MVGKCVHTDADVRHRNAINWSDDYVAFRVPLHSSVAYYVHCRGILFSPVGPLACTYQNGTHEWRRFHVDALSQNLCTECNVNKTF